MKTSSAVTREVSGRKTDIVSLVSRRKFGKSPVGLSVHKSKQQGGANCQPSWDSSTLLDTAHKN